MNEFWNTYRQNNPANAEAIERMFEYDIPELTDVEAEALVETFNNIAENMKCDVTEVKEKYIQYIDENDDFDDLNPLIDKLIGQEQSEAEARKISVELTASYRIRQWLKDYRKILQKRHDKFFDKLKEDFPMLIEIDDTYSNINALKCTNFKLKQLKIDVDEIKKLPLVESSLTEAIAARIEAHFNPDKVRDDFKAKMVDEINSSIFNKIDFSKTTDDECSMIFLNGVIKSFIPLLNDNRMRAMLNMTNPDYNTMVLEMLSDAYKHLEIVLKILRNDENGGKKS